MQKHLFVSTPCYGGLCYGFYMQSCLKLQTLCKDMGINLSFSMLFNESLIQRARNLLVSNFLKSEATHMMFIDADIHFRPEDIFPMLESDKDIICGIYPKKEINWQGVKQAMDAGVPNDQLKHHTGAFVVNLKNYDTQVTVPINQPVEIWNGGTGFMLIKREVFTGLIGKVPYYLNNVLDLNNPNNGEQIHEFFATQIEEDTKILLDRKSTRLNSSHVSESRMPSSA